MTHERAAAEAEARIPINDNPQQLIDHQYNRVQRIRRQDYIEGYLSALSAKEQEVRELVEALRRMMKHCHYNVTSTVSGNLYNEALKHAQSILSKHPQP